MHYVDLFGGYSLVYLLCIFLFDIPPLLQVEEEEDEDASAGREKEGEEEGEQEEEEEEREEDSWEKVLSVERFGDIISTSGSSCGERMGRLYSERDFESKTPSLINRQTGSTARETLRVRPPH